MSGPNYYSTDTERRKRRRGLVVGSVPEYPSQIEVFHNPVAGYTAAVSEEGYGWWRTPNGAINNFKWLFDTTAGSQEIIDAKKACMESAFAGMQCHIQQGQNDSISGPTPITVSIRGELQFVKTGAPEIFKNDQFWVCPPFFFRSEKHYLDNLSEEFHGGTMYPALTLPLNGRYATSPSKLMKEIIDKRSRDFNGVTTAGALIKAPPLRKVRHDDLIKGDIVEPAAAGGTKPIEHDAIDIAIELRRRCINSILIQGARASTLGLANAYEFKFETTSASRKSTLSTVLEDNEFKELDKAYEDAIYRLVSQIPIYEATSTGDDDSVFSAINIH